MSGKGSAPRPYSVTFERFDSAFDWAFGVTCKKCDHSVLYAGKGYCYMFKDKPFSGCSQFKEKYDDTLSTIKSEVKE